MNEEPQCPLTNSASNRELSASRTRPGPHGAYQIIGQLPQNDAGEFGYRIRHSNEPH
jgi:hypothetical protein